MGSWGVASGIGSRDELYDLKGRAGYKDRGPLERTTFGAVAHHWKGGNGTRSKNSANVWSPTGKATRGYDPSQDIAWLRSEIVHWILGNLMEKW